MAVAAAGAADHHRMRGQASQPRQTFPVNVVLETDLAGKRRSLPRAAADIAGEFGQRVELDVDAVHQQPWLQTVPITEQMHDRCRIDRLRRRQVCHHERR
jgi:hypothetical protein